MPVELLEPPPGTETQRGTVEPYRPPAPLGMSPATEASANAVQLYCRRRTHSRLKCSSSSIDRFKASGHQNKQRRPAAGRRDRRATDKQSQALPPRGVSRRFKIVLGVRNS